MVLETLENLDGFQGTRPEKVSMKRGVSSKVIPFPGVCPTIRFFTLPMITSKHKILQGLLVSHQRVSRLPGRGGTWGGGRGTSGTALRIYSHEGLWEVDGRSFRSGKPDPVQFKGRFKQCPFCL